MLAKSLPRSSASLRPQIYLTHTRTSRFTPVAPLSIATTRNSTTTAHSNDPEHKGTSGGHDGEHSHYDPPGGWLWGIRPGEKYEKEGWEFLIKYVYFGSFVIAGIAYAFKPDTSIQTWALEEARRRLEKEGILEDPNPEWKPAS